MEWRKSSRSGPWTDNCVEVAMNWKTSSKSTNGAQCVEVSFNKSSASSVTDACVEVAMKNGEEIAVYVRDSKDPDGPVLAFTAAEWDAFIGDENSGVKGGEFDLKIEALV